ncbi:MAG: hypothetical protein PHS18_04145 [Sphaerochaetaceae bacterium]|nr:hypothetical protein [Sphaerochaetaceae bacterium]MDD5076259.1 hypothetical protein [Sphaerochaetaceae bacterium]
MTFRDFALWEDDILPIYKEVGTEPFCYAQISHIICIQVVTRYSRRKYFLPVKGADGRRVYNADKKPLWQLNSEVIKRCIKRLASPDAEDHRYENLAKGLTGGSGCA